MTGALAAFVAIVVTIALPWPAFAGGRGGDPPPIVHSGPGAFGVGGLHNVAGDGVTASQAAAHIPGHWVEDVVCIGGAQTCGDVDYCDDGSIQTYSFYQATNGEVYGAGSSCPSEPVTAPPEVTPGLVLSAFRRVPLPASELVVQPPGGRTLVNIETNFYTEQGEFTRVVRLLGQRVELRIWPETFTWHYGDGTSEDTSSAGSAFPDLEITHRYLSKGRVAVSVDTTYAADFRVGSGPWRQVEGTVTIPGEAESLEVVTARPVLVGG